MKTKKLRILSALLAVAMLFALLPTAAFAADDDNNKCGENLTWTLDSDGTLTISGTGAMADYGYDSEEYTEAPWPKTIAKVVVESGVTTIGKEAFELCSSLTEVDMSNAVDLITIGRNAFADCPELKTVKLPQNGKLETIGWNAFSYYNNNLAASIEKIVIPASVTNIAEYAFDGCSKLTTVIFAKGSKLSYVNDDAFRGCSNVTIYCEDSIKDKLSGKGVDANNISSLDALNPVVMFDVDGEVLVEQNTKDNNFKATKPETPTKKGYQFTGWYTKDDNDKYELFDFDTTITENITLYAQWEKLPDHQLTVIGGTFTVKDETIETEIKDDAVIANVPVDAEVTVAFNKDAYADSNLTFGGWLIEGLDDAENYTSQEEFVFTMPQNGVRIEAMTKSADNDDSSWDAATIVTGAVIGTGTAILAYHIGTELYAEQVLGKDAVVPRTRGEVALLAWQLAGQPEPANAVALLTDEAKAQQWAVESGLLKLDAEGSFNAEKKLSKWKALRVLDKAQKQG